MDTFKCFSNFVKLELKHKFYFVTCREVNSFLSYGECAFKSICLNQNPLSIQKERNERKTSYIITPMTKYSYSITYDLLHQNKE